MPADLLQGKLDMIILKTLEDESLHGYAIAQRIEQASRTLLSVPQGSLYPALHRLENRGWLAASWVETGSGRTAKVYRLTPKGRRHLEKEIADWQRLSQAIGWVLRLEGNAP